MKYWKRVFKTFLLLPLSIIANANALADVDIISGKLQLSFTDEVVKGARPIKIQRGYYVLPQTNGELPIEKVTESIGIFPHLNIYLKRNNNNYFAEIIELGVGKTIYKDVEHQNNTLKMKYAAPLSTINANSTHMNSHLQGYRNQQENNELIFYRKEGKAILKLANGGTRFYTKHGKKRTWKDKKAGHFWKLSYKYRLEKEISPEGVVTTYCYEGKKSITIRKISPHDGSIFSWVKVIFCYTPKFGLKIQTSNNRELFYEIGHYGKQFLLKSLSIQGRPIQYFYYVLDESTNIFHLQRVEDETNKLEVDYLFPKENEGNIKVQSIRKDGMDIYSISYKKNSTLLSFPCGSYKRFLHNNHFLKEIITLDKDKNTYTNEVFTWVDGSLVSKVLKDSNGQILSSQYFVYDEHKNLIQKTTSNHSETYTSTYIYNENHLCIKEKNGNLSISYNYLPSTNVLCEKKTKDLTKSYLFNEHNLLIEKKETYSDFEKVETYTYDPKSHMLQTKVACGNQTNYEYDSKNNLIKESTESCSINYYYDNAQRMVKKVFPLGSTYEYDQYGNLIKKKKNSHLLEEITYNKQNLPILHKIGDKQKQKYYDNSGNLIQVIDYTGATTSYEYDEFNRCTKKTLPQVIVNEETTCPSWSYEYDSFGNKITIISPSGNKSYTAYNLQNKPILITYPDKSSISYTYDKKGNVLSSTLQDGSKIYYTYNTLGACVSIQQGAVKESWEYDGFLLNCYTNKRGLKTYYYYDEFGRKVAEDFEGKIKLFSYDNMGNLCKIEDGVSYTEKKYDTEGKLLEIVKENSFVTKYEYHEDGTKTKAVNFDNIFLYNIDGQLIESINALGEKTIKTFDRQKRPVEKRVTSSTEKLLYFEKTSYDIEGNITKKSTSNTKTLYQYDTMGRVIKQIESDGKETLYLYDCKGRLIKKTLPSKVFIQYEYDLLDRKIAMHSSDATINYKYLYQGMDLVRIKDLVMNKSFEREYSKFGELIQETNCFGLTTTWTYDSFGRVKTITLPDMSSITFTYKNGNVTQNFIESTSIAEMYDDELTHYETDELQITTDNLHQEEQYDALGRRITSYNALGEKTTYQYDPFGRLIATTENDSTTYYLYNGDNAIATFIKNGHVLELQVPSI